MSPSGAKSRKSHKVKEESAAAKLVGKSYWFIILVRTEIKFYTQVYYCFFEQDRRLIDSRQSTPVPDLKSVDDDVGGGVTADGDTLSENGSPPVVKNSRGRWSESEVSFSLVMLQIIYLPQDYYQSLFFQTNLLNQLVEEQESSPPIKWAYVAEKLHRTRAQCYSRWKTLQYKPRGDFTEAEDALILETVGSGGKDPSKGLWTSLSDQLQRDNRIVYNRYRALLVPPSAHTKKKKIIRWTAEMVSYVLLLPGNVAHYVQGASHAF